MADHSVVVFVCEHGAAKSILAAAYFNKLARERGLDLTAIARGTHPDEELSPKTVAGLQADGLSPTETIPRRVEQKDLESARRVVSFCPLPEEWSAKVKVEYWESVPPVSADYEKARDAIVDHLKGFLSHL